MTATSTWGGGHCPKGMHDMSDIRSTVVRRAGGVVLVAGLCLGIAAAAPSAQAAGSVKASVSLTGPGSATYGATVTLTGTAWRTGTSTKLVNATIWLQKAAHGTSGWVNLTSTRTSSTGTFAFSVQLNTPYDYRARYGGSPTYTVAVSPRIYPVVRQNVLFDSIKDVNWTLGTLEARGRIYPTPANGTRVWLQRYNTSTKTWSNYISGRTTGGNAITIRGNVGGNIGTYRIVAPQHGYYATGYSRQVTFAHYKWRGAFRKPILDASGAYYIYTPSESPELKSMELTANDGGTAWVDINTAGCKSTTVGALNFTDQSNLVDTTERVRVLNGTTHLRGPWTLAPGQDMFGSASLPNISRMRVQLEDASTETNGDPYAYFEVKVLCAN
jgi:hypothetical protein